MKIRKNGKVIRLTESDLQRIVKRTLNENEEGVRPCKQRHMKLVMDEMAKDNNSPVTIKSGEDTGFENDRQNVPNSREYLLLQSPMLNEYGSECFCKKSEFFAGGI